MVPNALDVLFQPGSPHASRLAGVTSDVSPQEWINWIVELYPAGRHIGVLYSERSRETSLAIEKAATARGLRATRIPADAAAFPDAVNALTSSGCDGVLMIPDAKVYNGPNIQRLLLWGIRSKKPVWAFSQKIVKAGALAGQYAAAPDVSRDAASLILKIRGGATPSSIGLQYPARVVRAVNERTAQVLDLRFSTESLSKVNERLGAEP